MACMRACVRHGVPHCVVGEDVEYREKGRWQSDWHTPMPLHSHCLTSDTPEVWASLCVGACCYDAGSHPTNLRRIEGTFRSRQRPSWCPRLFHGRHCQRKHAWYIQKLRECLRVLQGRHDGVDVPQACREVRGQCIGQHAQHRLGGSGPQRCRSAVSKQAERRTLAPEGAVVGAGQRSELPRDVGDVVGARSLPKVQVFTGTKLGVVRKPELGRHLFALGVGKLSWGTHART